MTIKYNDQYVDEKYVPILEPNLYTDTVMIPGVTYTDKYQTGPAGQIMVHKITKGDAIVPHAPGADFSHEAASDALIPIVMNNNFQKSVKMYGVQANAVAFGLAEENLSNATKVVKEGVQYSGLACMATEGTADTDTDAISGGDAAVAKLIELRKMIKDNLGGANFALVSTKIYADLLGQISFQIDRDPAARSAELLKRFGLNIIECNSFGLDTAKYFNSANQEVTVDLTNVEMIVGNYEAMSAIPNLVAMRIHDSENFIGSYAQVEMNYGFKVNSPDQIVVKKKAGASF